MKSRSDLILEAHELLDRWLKTKQAEHGGESTQAEWEAFLVMRRRTCCWNRGLMLKYCEYLRRLPASTGITDILLNRPQVYVLL